MKNILTNGLVVVFWCALGISVNAYTVSHIKDIPSNPNFNYSGNIYDRDLSRIEKYLFGQTYKNENNNSRLNRIEKELFNQNYSTMTESQRMNNILANYRGEEYSNAYYNKNSSYYPQTSLKNKIRNTLVGQPTGYTPSLLDSPYLNRFGPSFNRGYYGTNGWGYHNVYQPTMTGAGIHILD